MSNTEIACRKIRAATTESQVLAAVKEYVASLDPAEAAALPVQLLPSSLALCEEVIHSALQTIEDAVTPEGGGAGPDVADDLRLVLATAARRLAALSRG